jgi:hypothetical protein
MSYHFGLIGIKWHFMRPACLDADMIAPLAASNMSLQFCGLREHTTWQGELRLVSGVCMGRENTSIVNRRKSLWLRFQSLLHRFSQPCTPPLHGPVQPVGTITEQLSNSPPRSFDSSESQHGYVIGTLEASDLKRHFAEDVQQFSEASDSDKAKIPKLAAIPATVTLAISFAPTGAAIMICEDGLCSML